MAGGEERARQRKAAQLALEQLDWCIAYLRGIRKKAIADQLAANRAEIMRRLFNRDDDDRRD